MNLSFVSPDLDDHGAIISTNNFAIRPSSNLRLKQPNLNWVTVASSVVSITVNIGLPYTYDTVWLGYTNLSNTSTYQVLAANSSAALTSSPGYDSGVIDFFDEGWEKPHLLHYTGDLDFPWVRITLRDSTIGHFEAGRLYISKQVVLPRNIDYGWGVNHRYGIKEKETEAGTDIVHESWGGKRQFTFNLQMMSKLQMFQIIEPIIRKHGHSKDILVIVDGEEDVVLQSLMVYGRFSDDFAVINDHHNLYSRQFEVTEFI